MVAAERTGHIAPVLEAKPVEHVAAKHGDRQSITLVAPSGLQEIGDPCLVRRGRLFELLILLLRLRRVLLSYVCGVLLAACGWILCALPKGLCRAEDSSTTPNLGAARGSTESPRESRKQNQ